MNISSPPALSRRDFLKHSGQVAAVSALAGRLEAAGVAVASIDPVQPSLEDVFLEVVERAAIPNGGAAPPGSGAALQGCEP